MGLGGQEQHLPHRRLKTCQGRWECLPPSCPILTHGHGMPVASCHTCLKAAVLGISICCSSCLARAGVECGLSFSRHGRVMP